MTERDLDKRASRFVEMLENDELSFNEFVDVLMYRMDNGLTPKILRLLDTETRDRLLKELKDHAENESVYLSNNGCCQFDPAMKEPFLDWLAKCHEGVIEDVRMTTTRVLKPQ